MKLPHLHAHLHEGGMLSIDHWAQHSRLRGVNPYLKLILALGILILCLAANNAAFGLTVALFMLLIINKASGVPFHYVCSLLTVPLVFIAVSCLAIALDFTHQPLGLASLPLPGGLGYLSATQEGLQAAALLACRAYGAVCCLYFLSLTIPMQEIIMMLDSMHLPPLIIELMYLIYRYIFMLLDIQHHMTIAASSRLGYASMRSAWFSFTHISGNLLAASFSRSSNCLDAMDARCYNGRLRFLTHNTPLQPQHVAVCMLCLLSFSGLAIYLNQKGVDLF